MPETKQGAGIPDPRVFMPELLIPRRKPTGNVKIDWSHPLAQGLKGCYIFNGNAAEDLASGNHGTADDANTTYGVTAGKRGLINVSTGKIALMRSITLDASKGITLIAKVYKTSTGGSNNGMILGDLTASQNYFQQRDSSAYYSQNTGGSDADNTPSVNDVWEVIGITIPPATASVTGEWYKNGIANGTDSITLGDFVYDHLLAGWSSDLYIMHGSIEYIYAINAYRTPEQMWSLYKDPYQFLEPA